MEDTEKKVKISKETANRDFESWADLVHIDYDTDGMNEEDKKGFEPLKKTIIKAIENGTCIVNGDTLEYTIKTCRKAEGLIGKKIVIEPPAGNFYTGMDGFKETQNVHRMNGAMSAMTGLDIGIFPKLDIWDYSFFKAVANLFLSI